MRKHLTSFFAVRAIALLGTSGLAVACTDTIDDDIGAEGEGEGEGDDVSCGDGTEARAIEVEVAPRVVGRSARPGQGVRDGALLDAQFIDDTELFFSGACDPCAGGSGVDRFAAGVSDLSIYVDEESGLLDMAAVDAWTTARAAAIADGAITRGAEGFNLAPRWQLGTSAPGADHADAVASDVAVDSVQAGIWTATSLEVLPGNACAADEVRRLLDTPVDTNDDVIARDEAIGAVLTAAGGMIRLAVASTIAPEHFADIDTSPCTVSTYTACFDVLDAFNVDIEAVDESDIDVVLAGDHGMWQPMRFTTVEFLADGE